MWLKYADTLINMDDIVLITVKLDNGLWCVFGKSAGSLTPDVRLSDGFATKEDAQKAMNSFIDMFSAKPLKVEDEGPKSVKRKAK